MEPDPLLKRLNYLCEHYEQLSVHVWLHLGRSGPDPDEGVPERRHLRAVVASSSLLRCQLRRCEDQILGLVGEMSEELRARAIFDVPWLRESMAHWQARALFDEQQAK